MLPPETGGTRPQPPGLRSGHLFRKMLYKAKFKPNKVVTKLKCYFHKGPTEVYYVRVVCKYCMSVEFTRPN